MKILATLAAGAVLAISLIGCGDSSSPTAPATTLTNSVAAELVGTWVRVDSTGAIFPMENDTMFITSTKFRIINNRTVSGSIDSIVYPGTPLSGGTQYIKAASGKIKTIEDTPPFGQTEWVRYDYKIVGNLVLLSMFGTSTSDPNAVTFATADYIYKKL